MASSSKIGIDEKLVRKLASLMDETGLTEIEYGADGSNIRVSKTSNYRVSAPAIATNDLETVVTTKIEADTLSHPGVIKSPMVGVAYTSSDPDTPAFIKVGDIVSEGQTLLLIEAMKVFNPILASTSGRVKQILISSGSPVEFGEPLLVIE